MEEEGKQGTLPNCVPACLKPCALTNFSQGVNW